MIRPLIDAHQPSDDAEAAARLAMLDLLDSTPGCFDRQSLPAHFTAGGLVVSADGHTVLLHHHRKLDRWLHLGGHCDGCPDLAAVAARECFEESGIPGLILASPKPFDLSIHPIPAAGDTPAHWHHDVRFVFIAPPGSQPVASDESHAVRWFDAAAALEVVASHGTPNSDLVRLLTKWGDLVQLRHSMPG